MPELTIADILPTFPAYRVALVVARGVTVPERRSAALEQEVADTVDEVAASMGERGPVEHAEVQDWRAAYKGFGIKQTSYRSSVEKLLRNIWLGRGLAPINGLVDAYNVISIRHRMPIGADDLDRITPQLAFRFSRDGDDFIPLGDPDGTAKPPKPGEVVYAAGDRVLCRRWNWYQDGRSAITTETRNAVLTVQSLGREPAVEDVAARLCETLARHCGGDCGWVVADADNLTVTI